MPNLANRIRNIGLDKLQDPGGYWRNYVQTRLPLALAQKKAAMAADMSSMADDALLKFLTDSESNETDLAGKSLNLQGILAQAGVKQQGDILSARAKEFAARMGVERENIKQTGTTDRLTIGQKFNLEVSQLTGEQDRKALAAPLDSAVSQFNGAKDAQGVQAAAAAASQVLASQLAENLTGKSAMHDGAVRQCAIHDFKTSIGYDEIAKADPAAALAIDDQLNQRVLGEAGVPYKLVPGTHTADVGAALDDDSYFAKLTSTADPTKRVRGGGSPGPLPQIETTDATSGARVLGGGADYVDLQDADGQYAYRIHFDPKNIDDPKGIPADDLRAVQIIRDPRDPKVSPENPHTPTPAGVVAIVDQLQHAAKGTRPTDNARAADNAQSVRGPAGPTYTTRDAAGQPIPLMGAVFNPNEPLREWARKTLMSRADGTAPKIDPNDVGVDFNARPRHADQDIIDKLAQHATASPDDVAARVKRAQEILAAKEAGVQAPPTPAAESTPKDFDKEWADLEASITARKIGDTPGATAERAALVAKQRGAIASMSTPDQEHVLSSMAYGYQIAAPPSQPAKPDARFGDVQADPWGQRLTAGPPQGVMADRDQKAAPRFARPVTAPDAVTPELRNPPTPKDFDADMKDPWRQRFATPSGAAPTPTVKDAPTAKDTVPKDATPKPPAWTTEDREAFRQRARDKGVTDEARLDAVTKKWEAAQEAANGAQ